MTGAMTSWKKLPRVAYWFWRPCAYLCMLASSMVNTSTLSLLCPIFPLGYHRYGLVGANSIQTAIRVLESPACRVRHCRIPLRFDGGYRRAGLRRRCDIYGCLWRAYRLVLHFLQTTRSFSLANILQSCTADVAARTRPRVRWSFSENRRQCTPSNRKHE